jgi:cytochrome P450
LRLTCYDVSNSQAGSDTTSMTLNSLVLGLIAHPRVVEKAHEELDRVIGTSRLPTFGDEKDLPYIRAIVKEVLRWRTTLTAGVGHYSTVRGFFVMALRRPTLFTMAITFRRIPSSS